jgi:glutamine synthetase
VEFLIGFETEFILLKNTYPIDAINPHGWCNAAGFPSGSVESQVLREIARCLKASGVELQMFHSEAAPGQYEVITGPLPPLQAVDALVHTRDIIFNVASKHGLRATLAPRVFSDSCTFTSELSSFPKS